MPLSITALWRYAECHFAECRVLFIVMLWISLCWMSLCWVSWRPIPLLAALYSKALEYFSIAKTVVNNTTNRCNIYIGNGKLFSSNLEEAIFGFFQNPAAKRFMFTSLHNDQGSFCCKNDGSNIFCSNTIFLNDIYSIIKRSMKICSNNIRSDSFCSTNFCYVYIRLCRM